MNLQQIQEALTRMQEKDAVSLTHPEHNITDTIPKHTEIHPDWEKSRRKFLEKHPIAKQMFFKGGEKRDWQIRIPVKMDGADGQPDPNVIDFIEGELNQQISVKQYRKGVISVEKKVGDLSRGIPEKIKNVEFSIGKFLRLNNAPDAIIHAFEHDPYRANQAGEYDMIITGHPIDIYGGSTGRGWTSCMNVGDKKFDDDDDFIPPLAGGHLKHDVNEHHHMVYLVNRGGDIDHGAIARTSFKLHHSIDGGDGVLLPEGSVYGKAPPDFLELAAKKMREIFNVEDGLYVLQAGMYADSARLKQVCLDSTSEDLKITTTMILKLAKQYDELNSLDDDGTIQKQQIAFVTQIGNSINRLNSHDQKIITSEIFEHLTKSIESFCEVDDIDDLGYAFKALNYPEEMFPDNGREISSDFYTAMLEYGFKESGKLKYYFFETPIYNKIYSKLISMMVENDVPLNIILKRIAMFKGEKLELPINAQNLLGILRIYFSNPDKINTNTLYEKVFKGQTATTIIVILFEKIVEIYDEYDSLDELNTMVKNFKKLVSSMIDVNYKTLDLFRIVESESANIQSNSRHQDTPQDWLEKAIVIIGGELVKIKNGKVVITTTDETKIMNIVKSIKDECAEKETISRVSELIHSDNFNMIELFEKDAPTEDVTKKKSTIYRNPQTGSLWFGRGVKPKWIEDELAKGKTLPDLLI